MLVKLTTLSLLRNVCTSQLQIDLKITAFHSRFGCTCMIYPGSEFIDHNYGNRLEVLFLIINLTHLSGPRLVTTDLSNMFSSKKANYSKLKTNLRLCINRLKLLEKKKSKYKFYFCFCCQLIMRMLHGVAIVNCYLSTYKPYIPSARDLLCTFTTNISNFICS